MPLMVTGLLPFSVTHSRVGVFQLHSLEMAVDKGEHKPLFNPTVLF